MLDLQRLLVFRATARAAQKQAWVLQFMQYLHRLASGALECRRKKPDVSASHSQFHRIRRLKSLRKNRLMRRVFSLLSADCALFGLAFSVSAGRNTRYQTFCPFVAL